MINATPQPAPKAGSVSSRPAWRDSMAPYERPSWGRSLLDVATSIVPYVALSVLMYSSFGEVTYWATLALAIPTAGFLLRTFIVFHDCTHGSFLPSRRANLWVGRHAGGLAESVLVQNADQEARHVLEGGGAGERHGVLLAIEEPPVPDLRDARLQHRQAPVESGRCGGGRAAVPRLALHQGFHVLQRVEMLARIVRRGEGADQAAAHIGVEARPADAEAGRGLFGRCQIEGGSTHMLIC